MIVRIRPRGSRKGIALLYSLFASMTAAGMVVLLLATARQSDRGAAVARHGSQAEFLAQGASEAAKKDLQIAIANWAEVPESGAESLDGHSANWTITPTGFSTSVRDEAGIETMVTGYEIRSNANVLGHRATTHRIVNSEATPLFQFAVFYTSDLEIQPGPNMTLSGRVHSNRDMYLGSDATLTLNTNYVRAVGNFYRNRKDDPSRSPGTVNIRNWVQNPFDPTEPVQYTRMGSKSQMQALGVTTIGGYDSNFTTGHDADGNGSYYDPGDWLPWGPGALALWAQAATYTEGQGHTVMGADQGITEAVTPEIGSIAMFQELPEGGGDYVWDSALGMHVPCAPGTGTHSKGYYHENAGLSILTKADGTWKAYSNGVDVTSAITSAVTVVNGAMYDARQANGATGRLRVTEIDLQRLGQLGYFPSNGLLYAAHYGEGSGLNAKGIRLKNGAQLAGRLTVASEDPVYIKGDYNTVAKKGAAVIADAVNLLSNAWNDSKRRGGLPSASDTTYNCAMISGNQNTTPGGQYNGGLENLPRFHENWTGRTCTIRGSFVNTWQSAYASSAWVYGGDRYTAPNRNWSYETNFNTIANLPPFTPMAVSARDVVSW